MLLSDLCRWATARRRATGRRVRQPRRRSLHLDLERLIEYGRGDDAVGSKVPDVVAQFAPRADERRLDVISEGKWLDDPFGAAARKTVLHESPMGLIRQSKYLFRLKEAADRVESERD